jgi:hypothetical protein
MRLSERACLALLLFTAAAGLVHSGNAPQVNAPVPADRARGAQVQRTPLGDIFRLRLKSAPFPDPGRRDGYQYMDTEYPADPHYTDSSVAVLVPPGFRSRGAINLVFFFHGWNSTIDDVQQKFDLYRQFFQSRTQAVLVLPELAWNAPDSYGGKLEKKGGFQQLVEELLKVLQVNGEIRSGRPGNIVLAGHSGAYRVIAQILAHGDLAANIKGVWLFDALYDLTDQYDEWIQCATGRFVSVSAADGEETTDVDGLIASLKDEGVPLEVAHDDPDNDIQTFHSRVLFLQSDSDHYGVVFDRDEFRRLLESSPALAPEPRPVPRSAPGLLRHFPALQPGNLISEREPATQLAWS